MSIAVVSMIRNEADRYLGSALAVWKEFASEIIVYEDNSTDKTYSMLDDCTIVPPVQKDAAWGSESVPRITLWNAALASKADWLIWLDADMIPAADPRDLMARSVDSIAFRLYDLWDWRDLKYRADAYWQGHNSPRIWMIRNPKDSRIDWYWNTRGIHCGHLPANYAPARTLLAPDAYSILHYGYAESSDRPVKSAQYAATEAQMSTQEILHARSIADETYITFPLPFIPQWQLSHARASKSSSAPLSARPKRSLIPITDRSRR